MAVAVDCGPLRRHAAVVEGRLADEFDLDLPFEAKDRSPEHMVGVVVCGRPRMRCDLVLMIPGADCQSVTDRIQPDGVFQVVTKTFVPGS